MCIRDRGTYWVWDARLTSVLVLFLMYLGVIALWRTIDDPTRAGRVAAILTLVGAINIPIIKFSVEWWNTLHLAAMRNEILKRRVRSMQMMQAELAPGR